MQALFLKIFSGQRGLHSGVLMHAHDMEEGSHQLVQAAKAQLHALALHLCSPVEYTAGRHEIQSDQ